MFYILSIVYGLQQHKKLVVERKKELEAEEEEGEEVQVEDISVVGHSQQSLFILFLLLQDCLFKWT